MCQTRTNGQHFFLASQQSLGILPTDASGQGESNSTHGEGREKLPNVLWLLLDDVSTYIFPESGNDALKGKLPGFAELKTDGAVYYSHFYSPSSACAPSQVALFFGMEPGGIRGQHQFTESEIPGKASYHAVPPPGVEFIPEKIRALGYYASAGGAGLSSRRWHANILQ
jgi:arylsulfatase A-like enzyme